MQVRQLIAETLYTAVEQAIRQGSLPAVTVPSELVERPQNPENGDFASNIAMRLAKMARMKPLDIANAIAPSIEISGPIGMVEVAPPGFINIHLAQAWLQQQIDPIREEPSQFGNTATGLGRRVQIEFVSVNPTGPVHVGHARGAVLGSALANALSAGGFDVTREYYVNDAGTQMDLFYRSSFARYAQACGRNEIEIPTDGYQGEYLIELGKQLAEEHGNRFLTMAYEQAIAELGQISLEEMLSAIRQDLEGIGVEFDVWFQERTLFETGAYDDTMAYLKEQSLTTKREGAVWFQSSLLGEEKDNVLIRSTGQPTYFASDIAYHRDKFLSRKFDQVINIWGADHQGHVGRMKAVAKALGINPDRLTILISQLVTLKSGGDIVRASKRTGQIITLADLVEEVGADACRYFFLSRAAESQMDFDLELAKREAPDNPVYYVQYAHARIAGILRQAEGRGIDWSDGDTSLLSDHAELGLVRKMLLLPEHIDSIGVTLAPHVLAHYAVELATAFHLFYDRCRVMSSDPQDNQIMKARLKLVESAKAALARTLEIMGMSTPESM